MALPLDNLIEIDDSAVVCEGADLKGAVKIGPGCILHPNCTLDGRIGKISLHDHCIVEESVCLVNNRNRTMTIGTHNLFEVGCLIEADQIGSDNIFECKSTVPRGTRILNGCVIGAGVAVDESATVADCTIMFQKDGAVQSRVRPRARAQNNAQIKRYATALTDPVSNSFLRKYHLLKDTSGVVKS